ncbi:MAG: sensor histidine kinase [bacterium]
MTQSSFLSKILLQRHSLPAKLLLLTIVFILIAEMVVFLPSVAKFRRDWLQEKIDRANLIALSLEAARPEELDDEALRTIFMSAEIKGASREMGASSQMILAPEIQLMHVMPLLTVDLQNPSWFDLIKDALAAMFTSDNVYLHVRGHPTEMPDVIMEIFVEKQPLHQALWDYAEGIMWLSLIIGLLVAAAVYAALYRIFVRPMVRLTANMLAFQNDPQNHAHIVTPCQRRDEIGEAECVLANMQKELRLALNQKTRLAMLGEGVSKINHDLRNILSSAVLMSDRLAQSEDPMVQKLSPRLITALDRAIVLCRATLDYGSVSLGERQWVELSDIAQEAGESIRVMEGGEKIKVTNLMPQGLLANIDRTQMFRALSNLYRNAAEALLANNIEQPEIVLSALRKNTGYEILIKDNGPGIPPEALENLFTPFRGSMREGGSGLGLAIAAEVVRAHGGDISLLETGASGTSFRIWLPEVS